MTPILPLVAAGAAGAALLEAAGLLEAAAELGALDAADEAAAADVVLLLVEELDPQAASSSEPAATRPSTAEVFRRMNISLSEESALPNGGPIYLPITWSTRTSTVVTQTIEPNSPCQSAQRSQFGKCPNEVAASHDRQCKQH
jgi:hypothetical protein